MIYLDNNASTPVDPEVANEICEALKDNFGNPSSGHDAGLRAKASIEKARNRIAKLIGSSLEEIFFTSGGTESNNLAIIGTAQKTPKGHIVTSVIEHPSVTNPCRYLEQKGYDVTYVKVGSDGMVVIEDVEKAVRKDTVLITIMHANNETGVLQPVKELGIIARERGIAFHSDAAQSVGKIPVDVRELNVAMLTIVSHKFYGPKGIGALYLKKGVTLNPILFGAGHEKGLRPGTENTPGIAGLGKACEIAGRHMDEGVSHTKNITSMLYRELKGKIKDIRINPPEADETRRLPNTLNICVPGVDSFDLLEKIRHEVAASSGSACHAGHKKPSSVLLAMGISEADALSSLRLSTGKDNTEEEIKEAVEIIARAARDLRR